MSKSDLGTPTRPHPSMMDRGFTVINNKILENLSLSPKARLLLIYLIQHATLKNFTAYNPVKMKWLSCAKKTLQRFHSELIDAGYMRLIKGGIGGGSWYEFHAEPIFLKASEDIAHSEGSKKGLSQKGTVPFLHSQIINTKSLTNTKSNKNICAPMDAQVCLDEEFEMLYNTYGRKKDRKRAFTAFKRVRKSISLETLLDGVKKWESTGTPKKYWPYLATWLNNERWKDEIEVSAPKKPSAEDQYAHLNASPRAHKTEQETKQELEQQMPRTRANPHHVSSLMASVKESLGKQNMETRNVRNNGRRVIATAEQRHRDSGEDVITAGSSEAERMVRGVSAG